MLDDPAAAIRGANLPTDDAAALIRGDLAAVTAQLAGQRSTPAVARVRTPTRVNEREVVSLAFLFTDIQASTQMLVGHPDAYRVAVRHHHALLRERVEANQGRVFETVGDAVYAAFERADDAIAAAVQAQIALRAQPWHGVEGIYVRMAVHRGEVEPQDGHYYGLPLYQCGRLLSAAHGEQILLSAAAASMPRERVPEGTSMRDLGAHRLKDLPGSEHIYQVLHPSLPADFPPLRNAASPVTSLPASRTSLVGRRAEIESIVARLCDPQVRLLTLTGPGGIGKSRLAIEAARRVLDTFEGGASFVDLAPVTDPLLVPAAIAHGVDVPEMPGRTPVECLNAFFETRRCLLVIDNFEQVVDAAPVLSLLLDSSRRLTILVTSRTTLRISTEVAFAVPPLSIPLARAWHSLPDLLQSEAVQLFVQRASASDSSFSLRDDTAAAVAEICVRLDGLPLAIELAAARSRVLPPKAMLGRLQRRLALLRGGARDLPPRQQTLTDTITWSYALLSPRQQAAFRAVSVFAGGCTIEAAEAVAAWLPAVASGHASLDVVDELEALVDKSLLRQDEQPDGQPRFTMLETVREFAADRAMETGEAAMLRRQHAAYYVRFAEEANQGIAGPHQVDWFARLEREHDNLQAALAWAHTSGDQDTGLRLCAALWWFWDTHAHCSVGRRWASAILQLGTDATPHLRAQVLTGAGALASEQGDYAEAERLCRSALAIQRAIDDRNGAAISLSILGNAALARGRHAEATAFYEESLALRRPLGDRRRIAHTLHNLGRAARASQEYGVAQDRLHEALALYRETAELQGLASCLLELGRVAIAEQSYALARNQILEGRAWAERVGDQRTLAQCDAALGHIAIYTNNVDSAIQLFKLSLERARDVGAKPDMVEANVGLALAVLRHGDAATAEAAAAEALRLLRDLGSTRGIAAALAIVGKTAVLMGDYPRAATLLDAARRLHETVDPSMERLGQELLASSLTVVQAHLGDEGCATLLADERALPLEGVIETALTAASASPATAV